MGWPRYFGGGVPFGASREVGAIGAAGRHCEAGRIREPRGRAPFGAAGRHSARRGAIRREPRGRAPSARPGAISRAEPPIRASREVGREPRGRDPEGERWSKGEG